jgi:hypothetical protein
MTKHKITTESMVEATNVGDLTNHPLLDQTRSLEALGIEMSATPKAKDGTKH